MIIRRSQNKMTALLLSYPRSGNHWVRFLLEYVSGRPTLGCRNAVKDVPIHRNAFVGGAANPLQHVDPRAVPVARKSHGELRPQPNERLVLLLRDYRECVPRHNALVGNHTDPFRGLQRWLHTCELYVRHRGPKMVVYYEELLEDRATVIVELANFLGLTSPLHVERIRCYLRDHKALDQLCATARNRAWNPGVSKGRVRYHQNTIDAVHLAKAKRRVQSCGKLLPLTSKYVG